jgi:hypothetical protein
MSVSDIADLNIFFLQCGHIEVKSENDCIPNRKLGFEGVVSSDGVKNKQISIAIDFDNTITTIDSTAILLNHSMLVAGSVLQPGDVIFDRYQSLSQEYVDGIRKCVKAATEADNPLSTQSFIEIISTFEGRIQRKVERSELLKGLSLHSLGCDIPCAIGDPDSAQDRPQSLYELGKTMQLQAHAVDVLSFARTLFSRRAVDVDVSVVSLNWSTSFIRGALKEPPVTPTQGSATAQHSDDRDDASLRPSLHWAAVANGDFLRPLHIYASELETASPEGGGDALTTGRILCHEVMCDSFGPNQKRHVLQHILSHALTAGSHSDMCGVDAARREGNTNAEVLSPSERSVKPFSVFIGDSIGDMAGLVDADIGIVIGNNSTLRHVVSALEGIELKPLHTLLVSSATVGNAGIAFRGEGGDGAKGSVKYLYTCDTWLEIGYALFGDDFLNYLENHK